MGGIEFRETGRWHLRARCGDKNPDLYPSALNPKGVIETGINQSG